METFFYLCLFMFWTLFWSFSSVLMYSLKSWESWMMNWSSHCPKCNNILHSLELMPMFSWIKNLWKCKYCKEKVSAMYPSLEMSTWMLFTLMWYFLMDFNLMVSLNWFEMFKLMFWLSIWFMSIIYIFYDMLFLEIHEWVLLTWMWMMLMWLASQTLMSDFSLMSMLPSWINNLTYWLSAMFITITMMTLLYTMMLKELHEVMDISLITMSMFLLYLFKVQTWLDLSEVAMLNWMVWVLAMFMFFYLQMFLSKWSALGWGDLSMAMMMWLMLWMSFTFPWLMITYFVWSILSMAMLMHSKIKNKWKKLNTQIPFWPFLAMWFFMTVFYSPEMSNMMNMYF